jgi:N-dimethylarginine dimethylaminohydrolase
MTMMRRQNIKFAWIAFILLLLLPALEIPAKAKGACLEDIVVTNTRDDLLVYFSVRDCFTTEMIKAIQNGIPTTFNFFVQLFEKKDYALDKKIADLRVSHTIRYDNLKKTYLVTLGEKKGKVVSVKDFEEAKKLMSEIVGLDVAKLTHLQRKRRYRVRMMAQLDRIELPFRLHYVLFFLSLWNFETDWYTVEFGY